jgi:hypothetical protein
MHFFFAFLLQYRLWIYHVPTLFSKIITTLFRLISVFFLLPLCRVPNYLSVPWNAESTHCFLPHYYMVTRQHLISFDFPEQYTPHPTQFHPRDEIRLERTRWTRIAPCQERTREWVREYVENKHCLISRWFLFVA